MIIGVIKDQADCVEVPTKIFAKHSLTDTIATFTFKKIDGTPVRNFKGWYDDLGMVAKHFTVSSDAHPMIKRQYTICQTMETHILNALFELAKDILAAETGATVKLDKVLFDSSDSNRISLTLKNYNRPGGVATQIFNIDLIGYAPSIADKNLLVATAGSSNHPKEKPE
jgi:hypothetical protein